MPVPQWAPSCLLGMTGKTTLECTLYLLLLSFHDCFVLPVSHLTGEFYLSITLAMRHACIKEPNACRAILIYYYDDEVIKQLQQAGLVHLLSTLSHIIKGFSYDLVLSTLSPIHRA